MCDLARGIWTTHCKANIISINVLARIIYSCHCLILHSSDEAYEITDLTSISKHWKTADLIT
jgi:hypothetical protein